MSKKEGTILIVDDNSDLLIALKIILSRHFERIDALRNPNQIPSMFEKVKYDLILLDMNFSAGIATGNEGIYWMGRIREIDSSATVVFITAYGDVELAVKSMKVGAVDFILKSWDEQKILSTVLAAYELRKSRLEISNLKRKQAHLKSEIEKEFTFCRCQSARMKEVEKIVSKIAVTDASVLILGENGTGKEVVAREIHRLSHRSSDVFIKVDLGALPETLFESELFGHVKGAFTDAKGERDGRFVIASGGTLFLDEIGNLPMSLQGKLLSAIQNREVYPVGSSMPVKTDVRIISATNMPLEEMISEKQFREDLFFRINAIQLEVPSLRSRKDDIPLLAEYFLRKYTDQYNKPLLRIKDRAMKSILEHNWPGNTRELQHTIEKAVILSGENEIDTVHLFPKNSGRKLSALPESMNLEEHERFIIEQAIQMHKGNITTSARKLGINRSTLYQKMKKYGI